MSRPTSAIHPHSRRRRWLSPYIAPLSVSFYLSLSLLDPTPILTTSFQPFSPKRWRETESTREKHGEYSRGTAKKSRKPSRCRQHGEAHIRKRLDRSKDAFTLWSAWIMSYLLLELSAIKILGEQIIKDYCLNYTLFFNCYFFLYLANLFNLKSRLH